MNSQDWQVGQTYNFLLSNFSDFRGKVLNIYPFYIRVKIVDE